MRVRVEKVSKEIWTENFAQNAHKAVFEEFLPPGYDRIDFALLAIDEEKDVPVGYLTARESDSENVYLKHGGSFEPIKGTRYSWPTYLQLLEALKKDYKTLTTLVENKNSVYLKFAISAGFLPIGVRCFKGTVLVELMLEVK